MKRAAVLVAIVIALLAAATAFGLARSFTGTVDGGGAVSFDGIVKHRHVTKVRDLTFTNIHVTCDSGDQLYSPHFTNDIPVSQHKFHVTGTSPSPNGGTIKVRGTFTNHDKQATGAITVDGNVSAGKHCFGKHFWNAQH